MSNELNKFYLQLNPRILKKIFKNDVCTMYVIFLTKKLVKIVEVIFTTQKKMVQSKYTITRFLKFLSIFSIVHCNVVSLT